MLNVILISILFTYILIEGLSGIVSCFFKNIYIQNNFEYLIQNMFHQVV